MTDLDSLIETLLDSLMFANEDFDNRSNIFVDPYSYTFAPPYMMDYFNYQRTIINDDKTGLESRYNAIYRKTV